MVEKHVFQAEIQQLLNIVIHSLYTDKEIFIRELVSNAADALEKLRFTQSAGHPVFESESLLKITVETDEKEHRLVISDTGVGMTHAELVQNLGTIAHSGSKAFLQKLATEKKPDVSLIGQFGVGFYSASWSRLRSLWTLVPTYRKKKAGVGLQMAREATRSRRQQMWLEAPRSPSF